MEFRIVDTESAYRRLLAAPDAASCERIFRDELVTPFAGLARYFGSDEMAAFAMWGMRPDQFDAAGRARSASIIEALAAHDAWGRAEAALRAGWEAFAGYQDRLGVSEIVFGLMIADMSGVPQGGGYTGFGGIPGWIMTVYGAPDESNLQRVEACTVHELHHNLMGSVSGTSAVNMNMATATVGDYIVLEGLAESFAAELYGEHSIGPWVTGFDETLLEPMRALYRDALGQSGFASTRRYIFGDSELGIPYAAGYAIGYRVVQAYLGRTGKTVLEASFGTAREIIEESGFFA